MSMSLLRRVTLSATIGALSMFAGACSLSTPATAQAETPAEAKQDPAKLRREAAAAENQGRHAEAAKLYQELWTLQPNRPNWAVRAADNLGRSGSYDDALDLLDAAIRTFPDVLDLRVMLARTFHIKADALRSSGSTDGMIGFLYRDAEQTVEKVLDKDPKHIEARVLLASARLFLGAIDDALVVAEEVAKDAPDNYSAQAMLGRILYSRFVSAKRERRGEASKLSERTEAALTAAAKAANDRAFPHLRLGDLAAWNGRTNDALDHYQMALVRDPNTALSHDWLRQTIAAPKRRTFYLETLEGARKRDAKRGADDRGLALMRWYAAQSSYDAEDWATAAGDFEASRNGLPDYLETWWWIMQARFRNGEESKATKAALDFARIDAGRFGGLIAEDSTTIAMIEGFAFTAYNSERLVDSRDLNRVVAIARDTARAWNDYAFLCRETKQFETSLEAYRRALDIEPQNPQLLNDCAVILQYHLPNPANREEAKAMYAQALARADELLKKGGLSQAEREIIETAQTDATANLRALRRKKKRD